MATLSAAETERWSRIGIQCALSMVLGYLESFVPIPFPGLKLGLANIPLLVSLAAHDRSGAWCIGISKVLASGLLFGTPVSMAYSAAGTLLSLTVMSPLSRLQSLRLEMLSAAGALAHIAGQLLVAQAMLGTDLVWYSAPLLLTAGAVTGLLCGVAARHLHNTQERARNGADPTTPALTGEHDAATPPSSRQPGLAIAARHPGVSLGVFVLFVALVFRAESPWELGALCALGLGACALMRVRPQHLFASLRPVAAIALITLAAQVATTQHAAPLFVLGSVVVSQQALELALISVTRLVALSAASLAWTAAVGSEGLAKCIALVLRPLERLGISTAGFALALNVALACLPALIANLGTLTLKDSRSWFERLDDLVLQAFAARPKADTAQPTWPAN